MAETFTTVAKFQYSAEAQIVKGRLVAEGIKVFLFDNLTIDTDPLVSNAIGGVKLKVLSTDVIKARHILESIAKYSIDDDGQPVVCPNCNKKEIEIFSTITNLKSLLAFIFALVANLLTSVLPIYTKHKYRCNNCKTEFEISK
ncbi:DUF2007 domain-containing protein [Algibacter amylolyticus]|uniref:DUF2007 domain-containing protein n=1 Tax=Algibacter amylolyticus TaxID=1608400 RepID=A0A5M7BCV0_9FLAO|nr:DUF2007 domain-containing protein [Algibacter amylolyticus]KAA5827279.1 DUF2007 domain-containing protein [Algibacter amylolyticus]MBB5266460.1 DNA-directed RNA polymerase subunit RPC12/RpoP [Algibacter amylolyticus]TSJ81524.1 DUF2007 domain-containing protein [Algibacter amylolyticus]